MDDIRLVPSWTEDAWSKELREAVRDPVRLLRELDLSAYSVQADLDPRFPVLVPASYLARMQKRNYSDPLLRQVLSLAEERREVSGFTRDPLLESASTQGPGLIRKYADRALLIAAVACAVHCRYCFRRHFPYEEHRSSQLGLALDAIRKDTSIREVILSGGDPLVLPDAVLEELVAKLDAIPHVRRLRIHTRLPVVIPSRVTRGFLRTLSSVRSTLVLVLHFNHPNEISGQVPEALSLLRRSGQLMLNQSVLLRGVNDSVATLDLLSERLIENGVVPYYLHLLDRVEGTAHFEVDPTAAKEIHAGLRESVSGYMVPRLVREVPGSSAKTPMAG